MKDNEVIWNVAGIRKEGEVRTAWVAWAWVAGNSKSVLWRYHVVLCVRAGQWRAVVGTGMNISVP